FKAEDHEPKKLSLSVNKEGEVTAGDIQEVAGYDVLTPKLVICTLDKKHKFDAELEVRVGRGFATGEENKRADQPIGLIPIDSIFSPVTRVKYAVENTRVGQRTQKNESEMLKYRNFGKKSLNEIKDKLQQLGLSLGMKFEAGLVEPVAGPDGATSGNGAAAAATERK